ncbi:MAG: LamB/YcsF family protein [Candidatus Cyclobacteriaceae bacterium M2_1C_046]
MKSVDINCDMGESYGRFVVGNDKAIMPNISSCNIACGFHGGDPLTIESTIKLALAHDVKIGAHPSYPDLSGFGRRAMHIHQDELKAVLTYQICALKGMAEAQGGKLHHVKPHGALYNAACKDDMVAAIICKCVKNIDPDLLIYGSGDNWKNIAESSNIGFVSEVFADRNYNDDLTLVPRSEPDAIITDLESSVSRIRKMIFDKTVLTIGGKVISINAETICIHGDEPDAAELAKRLNQSLTQNDVQIAAPKK